jgi:hypothetical protein
MKTWDDVSKEMQSKGTPISALGYCKIAFDLSAILTRKNTLEEAAMTARFVVGTAQDAADAILQRIEDIK